MFTIAWLLFGYRLGAPPKCWCQPKPLHLLSAALHLFRVAGCAGSRRIGRRDLRVPNRKAPTEHRSKCIPELKNTSCPWTPLVLRFHWFSHIHNFCDICCVYLYTIYICSFMFILSLLFGTPRFIIYLWVTVVNERSMCGFFPSISEPTSCKGTSINSIDTSGWMVKRRMMIIGFSESMINLPSMLESIWTWWLKPIIINLPSIIFRSYHGWRSC